MKMGQRLDRFFAGSPRPLRLFFLGFVVALFGVALGFSIHYGPDNPLAYMAFAIGVLGAAIGVIAVAWGWYDFFFMTSSLGRLPVAVTVAVSNQPLERAGVNASADIPPSSAG